ncbi:MAG TPA: pyridoxamine 5'-phosphate oxidase family protein, partial [Casimicrobiaceae bacterium]
MSSMPEVVDELLQKALVCELAVIGARGQPVVHPLIPLWDGQRIYMTSSVLFSKKMEHIKRNPRVSLSITDPIASAGMVARCS